MPRPKLTDNQSRGHNIEIIADGRISNPESAPKLGSIPYLPVIMSQHGPKSPKRRAPDSDAKFGKIPFQKSPDKAPSPIIARYSRLCQKRQRKTSTKPQFLPIFLRNLVKTESAQFVKGNSTCQ